MKISRFPTACLAFVMTVFGAPAYAAMPMTYLQSHGNKQGPVEALTWGSLGVAIAVTVIVGGLLLIGVLKRRPPLFPDRNGRLPLVAREGGGSWIAIGVSISAVVLLGMLVWNMEVLANISSPARKPALRIEVTGHQWWWQVNYLSDDPAQIFETANEIHVPTGVPVQVDLRGADVIHSFWIPALTGKTDTIPGQTNKTWLEANDPGVYRGQCTEYCGLEHAKMGLYVIAESPQDFAKWRQNQLQPVTPSTDKDIAVGQTQFALHCGSCHDVRGTEASGVLGPDLSHLMTRKTIAAGIIPNTPGNLSGWIANPQQVKPGALMPAIPLTGEELTDIRKFLESLS